MLTQTVINVINEFGEKPAVRIEGFILTTAGFTTETNLSRQKNPPLEIYKNKIERKLQIKRHRTR